MALGLRQPEILELARRHGRVTVDGLAAALGVTAQTIRRDLGELAEAGRLKRVHGGAVLPSGVSNIRYEERRALNEAAKAAIGAACAAAIPDDASVYLNIGTTTEAVARALVHHRSLLVVTNNLNVAQILAANAEAEVIVTGGSLRRADGGLTGPLAVATVQAFRLDFAVIGCSALDAGGDLLDFDNAEVAVSQAILAQSRHRFAVADHSKFSRSAPARIGSLAGLDALYTDRAVPAELARRCAGWDTAVHLAAPA